MDNWYLMILKPLMYEYTLTLQFFQQHFIVFNAEIFHVLSGWSIFIIIWYYFKSVLYLSFQNLTHFICLCTCVCGQKHVWMYFCMYMLLCVYINELKTVYAKSYTKRFCRILFIIFRIWNPWRWCFCKWMDN
jgi:hypothetical protein